ncbi:MAG: nucleotidyltransferase family protein [archaeon]
MTYTEIKQKNGKKYFYRVRSVRKGKKFRKKRIYLGVDLSNKILSQKEEQADKKLIKEKINKSLIKLKPKIVSIIKKQGVKKAGIFGSYARGGQKNSSDIDILIEPTKKMGFFDIIRLENELTKKLNKKIDLITYASIHALLKDKILKEEVRII